eukprot:CAMPEP_0202853916 /NCGR_PEP_ID=MMETSP1389-20130828/90730_1 /ASSEMBLY_ACC=CAM_ASM_000865 /TAXON_ID=302021 /ORGANISM="Rhodomonas sp., Strain CCMP768" /LENGTH=213 /DNA_ID=CAMNT_0049532485 /DNA_START=55 /DNA_END=696 /DNA_ORIENTATION=-
MHWGFPATLPDDHTLRRGVLVKSGKNATVFMVACEHCASIPKAKSNESGNVEIEGCMWVFWRCKTQKEWFYVGHSSNHHEDCTNRHTEASSGSEPSDSLEDVPGMSGSSDEDFDLPIEEDSGAKLPGYDAVEERCDWLASPGMSGSSAEVCCFDLLIEEDSGAKLPGYDAVEEHYDGLALQYELLSGSPKPEAAFPDDAPSEAVSLARFEDTP